MCILLVPSTKSKAIELSTHGHFPKHLIFHIKEVELLKRPQLPQRPQNLNNTPSTRHPANQPFFFQRKHHLVHSGWRNPEIALYISFGRSPAVYLGVVINKGQILPLFFSVK